VENENEETVTIEETPAIETAVDAADAPVVETKTEENVETKTALDAISEAIDDTFKGPKRIESKADEQAKEDTRPRNADGTFKTETPEEKAARETVDAAKAAETPEQKAAREAEEAKKVAQPDHVNDKIPEGLNKRTAERMQYLIDTVKQQNTIVEQHNALFTAVQAAGTPEEFAGMLGYMRAVKSNDPATLEKAYTVLQGELRGLCIKLGKPIPEVNLLMDKDNADLVQEIREGKITTERAHQLAVARASQHRTTTTTAAETTAATEKAAHDAAVADLDAFDVAQRKIDGDEVFQAKYDVLVPALQKTLKRVDPREWGKIVREAYADLPTPKKAAAVVAAPAKTMPQRPKSPAGAGSAPAAPKSALDAVNAALGM
jgi:hypothetical protein